MWTLRQFTIAFLIHIIFITSSPRVFAANSGWDFNLTKRCIKSPSPGGANYYEDTAGCDVSEKNWTVAVQAEKSLGETCEGTVNQSLPINKIDSPVSLAWAPHQDEWGRNNWTVNLTTDLTSKSHPCGANVWTWYTLMDNVTLHGGPFAPPNLLETSAEVTLAQQNNANVTTRAFLGYQGFWNGKSHSIEINFSQDNSWGDSVPSEADIIWVMPANATQDFVVMDGRALKLSATIGTGRLISIKWLDIVSSLISRGYFSAPTGGWQNSATSAVYIGTEVNNFTATDAGKTTLTVTNFRSTDGQNPSISGDLNSDNKVDTTDYNLLLASFGTMYTIFDYNTLVANYGK